MRKHKEKIAQVRKEKKKTKRRLQQRIIEVNQKLESEGEREARRRSVVK